MKHYYKRFFTGFLFAINLACYSQTLTVNSTSISCATLGSATVSVSGGIGPFSFTWMPSSQTGSVATGLAPGTYSIILNDAGASTTTTHTTVFTSLVPLTSTVQTFSPTCFGDVSGVAVINLGGHSGTDNYLTTNGVVSFTGAVVFPLAAGSYSYQVIDAITGCSVSGTFSLSQPPALTLNIAAGTPTSCVDGSITLTGTTTGGTPGYIYSWGGGPATSTNIVSQGTAGAYIYTLVTSDNNSCSLSKTVSVTFIAKPSPTITPNPNVCVGGTLILSGSGGNTYQWSGPAAFNSSAQNVTITPLSLGNSGIYSLTATGAGGCTYPTTLNVSVGALPTITLSAPAVCAGLTLSLTANSSNGLFYFWTGPSGYNSSAQNSFISQAATINGGTYTLTATSVNNCFSMATINATVFPTPTLSAMGSTVCSGKTASLIANSQVGVTYLWSGPLGFSSTQQNTVIVAPTLGQTGNYTVIATGASGCTISATAGIALMATPVPTITSNSPVCTGSDLQLNGSGGLLYVWKGPGGFIDLAQNPVVNQMSTGNAGVYSLTVTALNSCTASISTTVSVSPSPTLTAAGSTICAGETLSLTATSGAGGTYLWSGPLSFTSNSQNVSVSSASVNQSGTYTVVIIDANTCTNTAVAAASVVPPVNIALSLNTTSICAQGIGNSPNTIVMSAAGAPLYTITAENYMTNSNPSGPSSSLSVVPNFTFSGLTTVTLQGTNGVCSVSLTAQFLIYPNPASVTITNPTGSVCSAQSVTLTATGANTYSWSSTSTNSFAIVNPVSTSSFSVIGTDQNGCSNTASIIVTIVPPPQNLLVITSPATICTGETATLAAIGASSYSWSTASTGSTSVISPTITTTYTVYASNPFGCANPFTVTAFVGPCTGINEISEQTDFLIYPNPAQDFITIRMENENSFQSVDIINSMGQLISTVDLRNTLSKTIDINELVNGVYFLQLKNNSGTVSKPIVISK